MSDDEQNSDSKHADLQFGKSKSEVPKATMGGGLFKLDFEELNQDFKVTAEFKKIKKLGTGAYGKVMQILHISTKKTYACKRFEEVFTRELRGKRLLRELNILKSVKHPCLNKLKCVMPPEDYSNFNEALLVLDLCDMDLKKLLKSSKNLQELQVKSIVYDILCGLNYLHKSQIIHRDLKPANILVNDDCTIQICDFGLARSIKGMNQGEDDLPLLSKDTIETEEDESMTTTSSNLYKNTSPDNLNIYEVSNDQSISLHQDC